MNTKKACLRFLACVWLFAPTAFAAAPEQSILVVHSYHAELGWTQELTQGLKQAFAERPHVKIYSEYLDAKRWPNLQHANEFLNALTRKYEAQRPDVLLVSDDPAFELLRQRPPPALQGVPIVFMGLNEIRPELTGGIPGITGIFETHQTHRTLELALRWTGADGVIVINDTSETGQANESIIAELQQAHADLTWIVYRDLPDERLQELQQYPDHWPILAMLPLRKGSATGPMLSQGTSAEMLNALLPNPLFYDAGWLMGYGLVGGYMLSGFDHAQHAVDLAFAILDGARPENLPASIETDHRWIFDDRELQRFGWADRVPEGAEVRYRTPGFFARHRDVVIPVTGGLILALAVIAALGVTVAQQRRAERRLRTQEQRLSAVLTASDSGVFELDGERVVYASSRWLELLGCKPGADAGRWLDQATESSRHGFASAIARLRNTSEREALELTIESKPPRLLNVLMTVRRIPGSPDTVLGVARDITARRQLEESEYRRQRLNALGELTGGIAHDFNNILTVINMNSDLIQQEPDLAETRRLAAEIRSTGEGAADLVRQLLAFGRRDENASGEVDLNEALRGLHELFRRLLGEQHELVTLLADEPVGIRLSSAQADQVLANLILNARDAQPKGGHVQVITEIKTDADGRQWSCLKVRDAGTGMDEQTRDRVFEPYFTTKPPGEGTGLGLSTVYGIVNATDGDISIRTKVGVGTSVRIQWPRHSLLEGAAEKPTPNIAAPETDCSILVVEDEPRVAALTRGVLTKAGYDVIVAENGDEGLKTYRAYRDQIDMVLTDVVLPRTSGIDMLQHIRALDPDVSVGLMSGYAQHTSLHGETLPMDVDLLPKPFSRSQLLSYVSSRLNAAA